MQNIHTISTYILIYIRIVCMNACTYVYIKKLMSPEDTTSLEPGETSQASPHKKQKNGGIGVSILN